MNMLAKLPKVAYTFPPNAFHAQKVTAALMMENRRGYVLNDLGTGKTRSVLFAFDALRKAGEANKMLVICPLSGMARTWQREIRIYFPWLRCEILYGVKSKREQKLLLDADIYIINHDGVEVMFDALVLRDDIDVVCVDEIAVYRNGRAKRTRTLREYVKPKGYVWGLTGSPIPRAVTDVWGPCSCLTPHTIPKFFTVFRDQLMVKTSQFDWEPRADAELRAVACMQPSVRFKLTDVTELPPRVMNYYDAPLSPKQAQVYDAMRKQALALVGANKIDALNAGAVLSKLLQIAIGYVYTREGEVVALNNTPRLQLILDLVDAAAGKVILFAPFKSAVAALSQMLANNQLSHAVITGDTSNKARTQIFNDFQETPKYKVLLAHPACMAHSITLTSADTTIWAGPVTSLEIFHQANARFYRVGQKHKTLVAMIGGTPAERRMYMLLGKNEKLQNHFLSIMEAITDGL